MPATEGHPGCELQGKVTRIRARGNGMFDMTQEFGCKHPNCTASSELRAGCIRHGKINVKSASPHDELAIASQAGRETTRQQVVNGRMKCLNQQVRRN